jgi:hypothetical protein
MVATSGRGATSVTIETVIAQVKRNLTYRVLSSATLAADEMVFGEKACRKKEALP